MLTRPIAGSTLKRDIVAGFDCKALFLDHKDSADPCSASRNPLPRPGLGNQTCRLPHHLLTTAILDNFEVVVWHQLQKHAFYVIGGRTLKIF